MNTHKSFRSLLFLILYCLKTGSISAQLPASNRPGSTRSATLANCSNWLQLPSQGSFDRIGDLDISGNQITVEAQINMTVPFTGGPSIGSDIVGKYRDPGDVNYLLRAQNAQITTTTGWFKTPDICPLSLNRTYHVAMVYDGTSLRYYKNGFLVSQVAASGNLVLNNWKTEIGFYEPEIYNTNFIGFINEVRIWNVARTQVQLQAYLNSPLPTPATQPGLLAYYTFDDLVNKQGNAAWNGTLYGSASINQYNPTCPGYVASNECCPVYTGTLSGNSFCGGGQGLLTFHATSNPILTSYIIVYNDGTTDHTQAVTDGVPFQPVINPTATTSYTLKSIGDGISCVSSANEMATVTVDNCCPKFDGSISGTVVCAGQIPQLTFKDATVPAGGSYNIAYTDGVNSYIQNNVTDNSTFNVQGSPTQTTIYKLVSISDAAGCTAPLTDTALVTFVKLSGSINGDSVCRQNLGKLQFHSSSNVAYPAYDLTIFDGTNTIIYPGIADGGTIVPSGLSAGNNSFTLRGIAASGGGCFNVVPDQATNIYIYPDQYPDFVYTRDACDPFNYHLKATGSALFNDENFSWNINGMDYTATGSVDSVNITFPATGINQVSIAMGYDKQLCVTNRQKFITIAVNPGNIILTPDTTICFGDTLQFRSVMALSYCWTPAADLDHPDSANPRAMPVVATNYTLHTETTGANLVTNADFTAGNTGFTSAEIFASTGTAVNTYTVGSSTQTWNAAFLPATDHTGGSGNMLIVNAGPSTVKEIWTEQINVIPGTAYTFSFWAQALNGNEITSFQTSQNDAVTTLLPMKVSATSLGKWQQFSVSWIATGPATIVKMAILNTGSTTATGHGFAIDDVFFGTTALQTESVQVALDKPVIAASDDVSVCKGSLTTLSASGAVNYVWWPAATLSAASGATVIDTAYLSQKFLVTGTDALGCKAKDSVTVNLFPKIAITHSPDMTVCPGIPTALHANGGSGYTWTPSAALDNPSSPDPVATVNAQTRLYVSMTDPNGCAESDSLLLSIRAKPLFQAPEDQSVCKGSTVVLKSKNDNTDLFSWSPSTGLDNPSSYAPKATPQEDIVYTLHIADPVCAAYDSDFVVNVSVKPAPGVMATRSNDIDCAHLSTQLLAAGGVNYSWTPATGLNDPSIFNPVAKLDSTTTFVVAGLAENGCTGYDTLTVIVKNEGKLPLSMANAFTPNGDGLNDCYGIKRWGDITLAEFSIYNRWGQRVFTTTNTSDCWDGTYRGQRQDTGQFIYVLRGSTFCGVFTKTGPVVLIR